MKSESTTLRDYQERMVKQVLDGWGVYRSVMMQMPTGTGKTHVLAAVVKTFLAENRGKIWIIAHRRELVAQVEETINRYGISKQDGRIRIMAIQWLVRHWEDIEEKPALVIIDEAHHARAKTYRTLWDKCPQAKFLGLTATPCRMNRCGFTDLFNTLITSWSIVEFIERGYLSVFDYVAIRTDSEEQRLIDSLEKRGADGDYQIKEMDNVLNRYTSIERLYRSVEQYAAGRKGIVYAINIDHARNIAAYYNQHGWRAVAIDSKTPAAQRKEFVEEFKAGGIKVLVNVDIFSEGFDCPDVEFVQMARPTLSLAKYLQQVGRGLRKTKDKETCILIDNVGLYRVFGLPTAAWDWHEMFRGEVSGKGVYVACPRKGAASWAIQTEIAASESEMEVIVSHEQLLAMLGEQRNRHPLLSRKTPALKAWQDEKSGLWGLRIGRNKVTDARFIQVFDIRHDRAAVRFDDQRCGLVNATGEIVWKRGDYHSMRFSKDFFLVIRTTDGRRHYLDLYSLHIYKDKPEIKFYDDIELLKQGGVYYSRTREVYVNDQGIGPESVVKRKFGITIADYSVPPSCYVQTSSMNGHSWGYACVLHGDHDRYYWIYRWLADGSIIVMDHGGKYYHARDGGSKSYIGCHESGPEKTKCMAEIDHLTTVALAANRSVEEERRARRQQLLTASDKAEPFCSGMKWGLKVGDHVTVPPIYKNVKPPVGKYCAVERNYRQWGVIALDGTWMIEPQYMEIEISAQGLVTGTKITGGKVSMQLP